MLRASPSPIKMASNRLPVYLLPKKSAAFPSEPPHRTSPRFAAVLINISWAKYVNADDPALGIVLVYNLSWHEVREQFRGSSRIVPKLLPPRRPENLDLSYPSRNFETTAHPHQAFVNACGLARSEKRFSEQGRQMGSPSSSVGENLVASMVVPQMLQGSSRGLSEK